MDILCFMATSNNPSLCKIFLFYLKIFNLSKFFLLNWKESCDLAFFLTESEITVQVKLQYNLTLQKLNHLEFVQICIRVHFKNELFWKKIQIMHWCAWIDDQTILKRLYLYATNNSLFLILVRKKRTNMFNRCKCFFR